MPLPAGPDVDALALEGRQQLAFLAAVKDGQRLIGNAAQRHQVVVGLFPCRAAQDETDIDVLLWIGKAFQIFPGAIRRQDFQRYAIAFEDLLVTLGGALE